MKIENKKTIILTVIGVLALLISVIGATYAYFTVNTDNTFGTPKVEAITGALGNVKLVSTENNLYLNLSREDMMEDNADYYYAVTDPNGSPIGMNTGRGSEDILEKFQNGEFSSEEANAEFFSRFMPTIGYIEVDGAETYDCDYTFEITIEGNMKDALTEEDADALVFGIDMYDGEPDYPNGSNLIGDGYYYDIYSTEFPLEISGTIEDLSSANKVYINAYLYLFTDYEQNHLIDKNMKLNIKAKSLSCTATKQIEKINDGTVYAQVVNDYVDETGVKRVRGSVGRTYDTFYYAGDITNNNVLYADHCWKMVITTEGNGVKMIYNGVPTDGSCNNTGDATTIGKSAFNSSYNSPAYVGYMYNKVYTASYKSMSSDTTAYVYGNSVNWNGSNYTLVDTKSGSWSSVYSSLNNNHYTCFTTGTTCSSVYYIDYADSNRASYITLTGGVNVETALNEMLYAEDVNTTDSTIKAKIDSWYESNLLNTKDSEGNLYSNYLQNTIYCNNRTTTSLGAFNPNGGSNTSSHWMYFNYNTLECENKTDQFTLSVDNGGTEGYGNNALKYPIALLSYKEASLAIVPSSTNYLNNSSYYWLLSPLHINSAFGWRVSSGFLYDDHVSGTNGVRPAVSLGSSVKIKSGDGSVTSPYVVGLT